MKRFILAAILPALCLFSIQARSQDLVGISYDSGTLYSISTATASPTVIGSTGITGFADIQYAPNGTLYGFTNSLSVPTLYTINPTTAQATAVGRLGLSPVVEGGLAIAPNGTAYGAEAGLPAALFSINLATGAGTSIGAISGGGHDINGLAYRSDGQLIGLDRISNSLLLIDPTTAASSTLTVLSAPVGAVGGLTLVNGMGYFSTSSTATGGSNSLYSFDPFTGANALIGSFSPTITGNGISGITGLSSAVPEPGSVALLLGMGVTGAGFLVRRRRQ